MTEVFGGSLGPYLLLLVCAVLPSEIWRVLGAVLARGLNESSPVFTWVRLVATALLAAVVAKILASPSGALAVAPVWGRIGGLLAGFAVFLVLRRFRLAILAGVVSGEALLVLSAWWAHPV